MNFPVGYLTEIDENDKVLEGFLGSEKPIKISVDKYWCVIELSNSESVVNFIPNLNLLLKHNKKAFVITAKSEDKQYDFVSRFFGPAIGIDEDPVTGSAHCYLATYWGERLSKKKHERVLLRTQLQLHPS